MPTSRTDSWLPKWSSDHLEHQSSKMVALHVRQCQARISWPLPSFGQCATWDVAFLEDQPEFVGGFGVGEHDGGDLRTVEQRSAVAKTL